MTVRRVSEESTGCCSDIKLATTDTNIPQHTKARSSNSILGIQAVLWDLYPCPTNIIYIYIYMNINRFLNIYIEIFF